MKNTFVVWLFFLLTVTLSAQVRRDYAVFFVAARYDAGWPGLAEAPGEIAALKMELENNYGFKVEVVEDATKTTILQTLHRYKTKKYGSKDQLLMYFSMHGVLEQRNKKGYLIPKDGLFKDPAYATWLSYHQVAEVADSIPCKHILLALDAAYAGDFGVDKRKRPESADWENPDLDCQQRVSRVFNNRKTRKFLVAGGAGRIAGKSQFADHWLTALHSGGKEDGLLSFSEITGFVGQLNDPKPPWGKFVPETTGDFVLVKKDGCAAKILALRAQSDFLRNYSDNMVLIRGGTFLMGSTTGEEDEQPVHNVTVADFYLSKYELTVAEFKTFIEASDYQTDAEKNNNQGSYIWNGVARKWELTVGINWRHNAEGALWPEHQYNHPVLHVSCNDAMAYCAWLSQQTGRTYRLPTEAEWEYAAGNGMRHTPYSWGDAVAISTKKGGNVADKTAKNAFPDWTIFNNYTDGYIFTAPVGSFRANDFGLFDMTGNVWEWCSDWKGAYPSDAQTNPAGPDSGLTRVLRGGSWFNNPQYCRITFRHNFTPGYRRAYLGFRVARSVSTPTPKTPITPHIPPQ